MEKAAWEASNREHFAAHLRQMSQAMSDHHAAEREAVAGDAPALELLQRDHDKQLLKWERTKTRLSAEFEEQVATLQENPDFNPRQPPKPEYPDWVWDCGMLVPGTYGPPQERSRDR
jgi:hypothetical protein